MTCPRCGGINYALDTAYCRHCPHSSFIMLGDRIANVGCNGQCLRPGFFDGIAVKEG